MIDERKKLHSVLERFSNGMLVTLGSGQGGDIHSRPMAIAKLEDDCSVWFFTDRESPKVKEIDSHNAVQLVFQSDAAFASMTGLATVTKDRAKIDELWNESYKTWFPNGKDDPGLVLLHVTGREAEYWDNERGNRVKYAFKAIKAYATGTRPKMDEDQHGKTTL